MNDVKRNNVLVAGCAGFIASRVASMLLEQGYGVVGLDNFNNYYDVSLKYHRIKQLKKHPAFNCYECDISDRFELNRVFQNYHFDAVYNLAARAGVRYSMENPHVYMETNAIGNLNLLEEIKLNDIPKYVLASTSSLYAGQKMPFAETLPVNSPISPYAASKKAAEAMAYSYHYLYGLDVSVVRYFTVYGPAGRPDMSYFRFIKWIDEGSPLTVYGDGTQSRDFTYVDDIARGTIAASRKLGYEVINLGGGKQPHTINQLIELIEQRLGKKAMVNYYQAHKSDMDSTWADIEKADRLLEWKPRVNLDDGLGNCVDWYLDNKSWLAV